MLLPLVIPKFLSAVDVSQLRRVYEDGIKAGRLHPGPSASTNVRLAEVLGGCRSCAAKGSIANWGRLRLTIGKRVAAHFGVKEEVFPDYTAYTRLLPGGSHVLHADAVKLDGTPNHCPWRVLTAMIYLSDHGADFEGGELNFPKLGVRIEPKPGLLVGFLDTVDYQHEVFTLTRGVRDAIAIWYTPDAKHLEGWPFEKV